MLSKIEALEKQLAETQAELQNLKRLKHTSSQELAEEDAQNAFCNPKFIDWIQLLFEEFSTAKISAMKLDEFHHELNNNLQNGRHPVLFTVKTENFSIQYKGENGFYKMRFSNPQTGEFYYFHREFYAPGKTEYYGFDKKILPQLIHKTLKLDINDDLMFRLPFYAEVFYGLLRSFVTAYLVNAKVRDAGLIGIEELNRIWK